MGSEGGWEESRVWGRAGGSLCLGSEVGRCGGAGAAEGKGESTASEERERELDETRREPRSGWVSLASLFSSLSSRSSPPADEAGDLSASISLANRDGSQPGTFAMAPFEWEGGSFSSLPLPCCVAAS